MGSPIKSLHFLDTSATATGLFDTLFGGLFLVKGMPLLGQLLWLCLTVMAALGCVLERVAKDRLAGRVSRVASWSSLTVAFFFLLQPWDEVFINLRHPHHWAQGFGFSFNRAHPVDATVDWLVYWLLGVANQIGVPLIEGSFLQGLTGAIACVLVGRRLWSLWTNETSTTLPTFALCFFPPLAFNSAHGFATTWFAALLLFAIERLFFAQSSWIGLAALAALPLVRLEGLLFALVFFSLYVARRHLRWPKTALLAMATLTPTLLLSMWRQMHFGSWLPTPILYKATGLNWFYFALGMRNLAADLLACGGLLALMAVLAVQRLGARPGREWERGKWLTLAVGLCCLPYYVSGGDWFPSYWGRYLFPFSFLAYTLFLALVWDQFRERSAGTSPARSSRFVLVVVLALWITTSLWPISSNWKFCELLFSHRRTLAKIHPPTIGRGHYRIQYLSQLGHHLRATTPTEAIIGSSEVATIMYFAERDALDMLGVANPEIAQSPVRPSPSLVRRFPMISELPYLIFKRIRPDIFARERPAILYTFDFMWRDLMPQVQPEELSRETTFVALDRWERKLGGLMDTLYGGTGHILELGYEPVLVRYSNHFIALYFVRTDLLEDHVQRATRAGFRLSRWARPTPS